MAESIAERVVNVYHRFKYSKYRKIQQLFRNHTMIPEASYILNLLVAERINHLAGVVVECGTWKGGMIAGIAKLFSGEREYFLFDSFEGLPEVKSIDGQAAAEWQQNTKGKYYFDNCSTEESFAHEAMKLSGAKKYHIIKGWFNQTLPLFDRKLPIALLRLDGDWYESTMECLENLYPQVVEGGIIIIDDYYMWDGCSRAVHDYFSKNQLPHRIKQFNNTVCYIVKESAAVLKN